MDAISAVSSPQTKAPAPSRISMSKLNWVSQMWWPRKPCALGLADGGLQPLHRQRILGADIDVALVGADGIGGDGHALEHPMGVGLQDGAVHEGAGVALVGVADDVLLVAGVFATVDHLRPVG
jgi:hypothetical protein